MLLIRTGFVDEHDLRKPTGREFVELVGTLVDLLVHSCRGWVEDLSFVMPPKCENTGERESLVLLVDLVDVMELEIGLHHYWAVTLRRAE